MKNLIAFTLILVGSHAMAETLADTRSLPNHASTPFLQSAPVEPMALEQNLPVIKATGKFESMAGGACKFITFPEREMSKHFNTFGSFNKFKALPPVSSVVLGVSLSVNDQLEYKYSALESIERRDFPLGKKDMTPKSHMYFPETFGSVRKPILTFDGTVLRFIRFDLIDGQKLIRIHEVQIDSNLKAPTHIKYRELEGDDLKTAKPIEGEVECIEAMS